MSRGSLGPRICSLCGTVTERFPAHLRDTHQINKSKTEDCSSYIAQLQDYPGELFTISSKSFLSGKYRFCILQNGEAAVLKGIKTRRPILLSRHLREDMDLRIWLKSRGILYLNYTWQVNSFWYTAAKVREAIQTPEQVPPWKALSRYKPKNLTPLSLEMKLETDPEVQWYLVNPIFLNSAENPAEQHSGGFMIKYKSKTYPMVISPFTASEEKSQDRLIKAGEDKNSVEDPKQENNATVP